MHPNVLYDSLITRRTLRFGSNKCPIVFPNFEEFRARFTALHQIRVLSTHVARVLARPSL